MDNMLGNRIVPSIFHERQEPDSSLCAQHCLNNLVQDSVWTAADLADLATQLDQREDEARGGAGPASPTTGSGSGSGTGGRRRRQPSPPPFPGADYDSGSTGRGGHAYLNADRSRNMDDSGFFSSQVMDEALKTYNLQLVRWRHPSLRSIQEAPEQQEAFVLNLQQHWFVIRRFGHSRHFWYDLNSFHPSPKHVSPLYLGLQIDQAEHEGYNVFVVLFSPAAKGTASSSSATIDPSQTILPPCEADQIIYGIAEEARTAAGLQGVASDTSGAFADGTSDSAQRAQAIMDDETVFQSSGQGPALAYSATGGMFGGEDAELNRAIEASLRDNAGTASSNSAQKLKAAAETWKATRATRTSPANPAVEEDDPELAAAIAASLEMEQAGPSASVPAAAPNKAFNAADEDDEDFWKDQDPAMDDQDDDDGKPASAEPGQAVEEKKRDTRAQTVDEDEEDAEEEEEQEEKPPTAEELRAKRLARFG